MNGKLCKRIRWGALAAQASWNMGTDDWQTTYKLLKKDYRERPYHTRLYNKIYGPMVGHSERLKQRHRNHDENNNRKINHS